MTKNAKRGSRQPDLFPRAKTAVIPLSELHPMVVLTDVLSLMRIRVNPGALPAGG